MGVQHRFFPQARVFDKMHAKSAAELANLMCDTAKFRLLNKDLLAPVFIGFWAILIAKMSLKTFKNTSFREKQLESASDSSNCRNEWR